MDAKLVVDKTDYSTDKIVIKGSENQLKRVVAVKALADLNNIPEQAAGTYTLSDVPLKAYDVNGEVVDVEIVPSTINIDVTLASPSKEVPIKIIPKGEVASSYSISSLSSSETKVIAYGNSEALANLNYVPVYIDVNGLKENKTYKVEIEKPVGIKSLSVNNVTVSLSLGSVSTKKIDGVSIEPVNLGSGYTVQGMNESATRVSVTLRGDQNVINGITADDITAYIDLDGLTEGEHDVEVKVEGTDNKVQYTSMTKKVKIKISKK